MSGNPLPWIVLASVVLGSLLFKGYLKFPAAKPAANAICPRQSHSQVAGPGPANDRTPWSGSGVTLLGLAFAKAKRIEAE